MRRKGTGTTSIQKCVRDNKILDLRVKGWKVADIAEEMGMSESGTYKVLNEVAERFHQQMNEHMETLVMTEVERCDAMIKELMKQPTLNSLEIRAWMDQRAKYLRIFHKDRQLSISPGTGVAHQLPEADLQTMSSGELARTYKLRISRDD